MLELRANEIIIVEALKSYLSTDKRPCEVVRQNQVAEVPPYPYVSYTITTPINTHHGTYSQAEDGTLYKDVLQTWSFTVQSDDQDEAMSLALKIHSFFSVVGVQMLADKKISVHRVQGVTTRDNLLTIQYEYRNGLDVTFGLLFTIDPQEQIFADEIETINLKEE